MDHEIIKSIACKARKCNFLQQILDKLHNDFSLVPIIGAEIEFYITSETLPQVKYPLKEEKGNGQFEIDILPQENIFKSIDEISQAKAMLLSENVLLHPKPFQEDYGSAMHFHINLVNTEGENFFDIRDNLEHAAQSMCHFLAQHFLIFAPRAYHYHRFSNTFMAPTHICFGGNNRSVAIRIPDAKPIRLEHRVSSPETDEYLAICAILEAIYQGLKYPSSIGYYEKIYGNAFDKQYGLTPFPANIDEAVKLFNLLIV